MTQSKLEVHLQILKAVAQNSQAKAHKIVAQAKTATEVAKQSLTFLTNQGLIDHNQNTYHITCRGTAVLRHFGLLEMQPQAIENY
jgi:predicted transcriptional regulator